MQVNSVFHAVSPQAAAIVHLFVIVLIVCGIIFAVVAGLVTYNIIRFRRQSGAGEPPQTFGNRQVEIVWTLIPILILIWLFVLTVRGMQASDPVPNREPELVVIGHQWWWELRYPETGVITANELHIPTGKKLLVRLESADVIHDFWVPQLSRKMDMVPGHPNHIWLQAERPGTYLGTCAEYCGTQHAWMRFLVIAQSPDDYVAWLQHQRQPAVMPANGEAAQGSRLFQQMTCANCHAIAGSPFQAHAGPDLTHLIGRAQLGAGVATNNLAQLTRWLANPQAIKPGCLMPNLQLDQAQLQALVRYLETLQ